MRSGRSIKSLRSAHKSIGERENCKLNNHIKFEQHRLWDPVLFSTRPIDGRRNEQRKVISALLPIFCFLFRDALIHDFQPSAFVLSISYHLIDWKCWIYISAWAQQTPRAEKQRSKRIWRAMNLGDEKRTRAARKGNLVFIIYLHESRRNKRKKRKKNAIKIFSLLLAFFSPFLLLCARCLLPSSRVLCVLRSYKIDWTTTAICISPSSSSKWYIRAHPATRFGLSCWARSLCTMRKNFIFEKKHISSKWTVGNNFRSRTEERTISSRWNAAFRLRWV